jgi:hypothetical protein
MKKKILKLLILSFIGLIPMSLSAQLGDVANILKGGVSDANKLTKAYLNPVGKGFAVNLSNGWYNTAKPHSFPNPGKLSFFLGFDITLTASVMVVPDVDKIFDVSTLDLTTLTPTGVTKSPTVSGSGVGAELGFGKYNLPNNGGNAYLSKFNMPSGASLNYIPSFMLQGGIGLPFSSEIDFRYVPTMELPVVDGKIGLWGIGIKHDIKQWIPVISMLPFFDISAQMGYTTFKSSVSGSLLPLKPFSDNPDMYYTGNVTASQFNNQGIELNASSFTGNIIVSTDIPVFNVYAGIGFYTASSTLKMTGNFPVPTISTANPTKATIISAPNPVNVDFTGNGGFRSNIGVRLKLLVLAINADITYAGGSTIYTAGFGINFH